MEDPVLQWLTSHMRGGSGSTSRPLTHPNGVEVFITLIGELVPVRKSLSPISYAAHARLLGQIGFFEGGFYSWVCLIWCFWSFVPRRDWLGGSTVLSSRPPAEDDLVQWRVRLVVLVDERPL